MAMMPAARPRLTEIDLARRIAPFGIDRDAHPLIVVGIRGYYLDSMGARGKNDRGIYDDAIFLDAPECFAAFNANTDPSKYRPGIASLKPGVYYAHRFDLHRGKYLALCQRAGAVTVIRDGGAEESGWFGINIHRGGLNGTSSEGCQTIPPAQWEAFISLAVDQAHRINGTRWREYTVPYVLIGEVAG